MAVSSLQEPPTRDWQHFEDPPVPPTLPPPGSPTPKPKVALPESTPRQPESPCSLSEAPNPRLPDPIPSLHTAIPAPQPGSIQAIIREQCRSRLYVPPIAWTSNQLRLLRCQFAFKKLGAKEQEQGDAENESATQQRIQQRQKRVAAAARLARRGMASWRRVAVEELLDAYNIRPLWRMFDSKLPFRFGGRAVASVKTDGIFSADSTAPLLAYINLDTVDELRHKHVCRRAGRRHSAPVASLRQKKLRFLQPPHKAQDPYVVAALIALAQAQQFQSRQTTCGGAVDGHMKSAGSKETEASLDEAPSFKVHVLAIPGARAGAFFLYRALISSEFLDNLEKPWQFSPSCPMVVSCYPISLTKPEEIVEQLDRLVKVSTDEQGGQVQDPKPGSREHMFAYHRRAS